MLRNQRGSRRGLEDWITQELKKGGLGKQMSESSLEFRVGGPYPWISEDFLIISALPIPAYHPHPRPQGQESGAPTFSTHPKVPRLEGLTEWRWQVLAGVGAEREARPGGRVSEGCLKSRPWDGRG